METTTRDYYFDNLKGFLIISVILGNALECISLEVFDSHAFVLVLYLFHMPLFTLVSGYFAKRSRRSTKEKVKDTIKIYLIAQIIYSILYMSVFGKIIDRVQILYPCWTLWYLLSLIFWYIISDYITNKKLWLIGSMIISLIIGLDPTISAFGSVSRTFFFLPFFVAGYSMDKTWIDKLKKYKWVVMAVAVPIIVATVLYAEKLPLDAFFEFTSYRGLGITSKLGIVLRTFHYVAAFVVGGAIMAFMPKKKIFLAFWGSNSLTAYLTHSGVIRTILALNIIAIVDNKSVYIFLGSVFICVFILTFVYSKVSQKIFEIKKRKKSF